MQVFMQHILPLLIAVVGAMIWLGINALLWVYCERKFAGHIQRRPGPFEVGPHGALQPLIDGLKLMGKQLVTPDNADNVLYWTAPIMTMIPVLLLYLPIPYGPVLTGMDVNLALLLILAFSSFNGLAVILAGWSSNNKWGVLGAARAVSQAVAYEIPLLLTVLAISFMTGTLSLVDITNLQAGYIHNWFIFKQPLAFIIFIVAMFGETNRAPFDLAEAESELTAGFHVEYSAMGFGCFFLAEYGYMVVMCSVCSVLFLGGYHGPIPGLDGWWWMVGKTFALMSFMLWVRWTYPRVRFDQLLNINWKWLLPLATANLLATALIMKL
ncbi:MAG: NADH-quinone oxidoreductase subunit NuoH [Desulfovibrionaceae bacterium]|nr:NADH-quinone oxidoreductase subunit NuoH [Desulfovibrionaceae bacterium]